MSNDLTKQEYLKRYLENKNSDRKRKKKVKSRPLVSRLKIVDQDIDLKSIPFGEKACNEDEIDEDPVVAEVIDERPVEIKVKELYESSRWKKIDENSQFEASATDDNKLSSKQRQHSSNSHNYVKRHRYDSDNDLSPSIDQSERTRHKENDYDNNHASLMINKQVIHKIRHDSDSDMSPPRQTKGSANKKRFDSDNDISPPRETKENTNKRRYDSDSDISPPRKTKYYTYKEEHCSNNNISPVHSTKRDICERHPSNDVSSSRRQNKIKDKRRNFDSDISPDRQHYNKTNRQLKQTNDVCVSEDDENFVKYKTVSSKNKAYGNQMNESDSDISPPRYIVSGKNENKPSKTLSGLKAGLQNSETLMKENQDLRKREKIQINLLDYEISGKNAETVVRDRKTGLKIDLDEKQKIKEEKKKEDELYQKKYAEWGKGIEQTQSMVDKFEEDLYEMSKPLARYQDDEDLDERLKNIVHEDDPMAEYIKKKRQKDLPTIPVYSGPQAPPNRFGILPGYRWDGVDRSNGFEKRYFEKMNSSKAVQEEAYLWSVQNM